VRPPGCRPELDLKLGEAMKNKVLMMLTALALGYGLTPQSVSARSSHAAGGSPYFGSDASCFVTQNNNAIMNTCSGVNHIWAMPVIWDTPTGAPKSISVTANVGAGGSLSCNYVATNQNGSSAGFVSFPAFPAIGWSTQTITLSSVPAGSMAQVWCMFGSTPNTASILGLNNFAP
jgi:hypothetical protein